ncbi:hypothetical protein PISMIDRAFT_15187 [Pisolithus microcarpus 441]|uniref:Uncharacterized protein n=1 Tax=Pisolithus microcarpus 441 TaxID=765257 RepID=A0A0C9Z4H5_9AGAM|nr:hypothetical protein PISMIDRAFT_15187 [Pisolithus microcarpus 441]
MAPKSNKGSMLQKKNSRSASKPLKPNKDREDLYGDDLPPLERTDGYQQARPSEMIVRETPDEADIAIILEDEPSALTKLTTETALIENTRAEGSGKGKEKEGPDTRKKPPTFPEFIQELKDILAECTSQWENFGDHAEQGHQVCTFRKLYNLVDMPNIESTHNRTGEEGRAPTHTKTLHEERTLVEWRQLDINQLTTGWIVISCLTWEEVSNKKKPTSGELAWDTQATTQVMTQTTTQMTIWTGITVEEIIATIVMMIAGEEDPQLLLIKTREMTRRRNAIADTVGDCKEITHTEG